MERIEGQFDEKDMTIVFKFYKKKAMENKKEFNFPTPHLNFLFLITICQHHKIRKLIKEKV